MDLKGIGNDGGDGRNNGRRGHPAQIGSLITALRMKGETVEEVTGAARIMRQKATHVNACATTVVDTCGTGGDRLKHFQHFDYNGLCCGGSGHYRCQARQPGRFQCLRQRRCPGSSGDQCQCRSGNRGRMYSADRHRVFVCADCTEP